jgi:hypothetical protein
MIDFDFVWWHNPKIQIVKASTEKSMLLVS